MLATVIYLLIALLVLFIVWYILRLAATQFGVPDAIMQIMGLILLLIFILIVLNAFGIASFPIRH